MHIGEKIKARVKELRMGPTELARQIRTSKQNVYGIYQRSSIDTDLLAKLSKVLEFDFFVYYSTSAGAKGEVNAPYPGYKRKKGGSAASEELNQLRKDLQELREKYELLRALYETKTGQKVPGSV